jgi:DNA-binding IclR family transcriptional regulator
LDMSASRTHRYLSSLQHAGFVRKNADTGHYDMGPATIEIGIAAMERVDGAQVAADIMKDLTNKTGLCSYLCVWGSNGPTVVRSELGSVQTAVRMREGTNLSMLTATGQIFHAFMPEAKTRELVERDLDLWNEVAPEPLTSLEQVLRGRARVQKLGIARSRGMRNPTWTAFSCPIFDGGGEFKMAMTLIGVSALFDINMDGSVARELRAAGEKLSRVRRA